jgi:HEAT repeat protein
MYNGWWVLALVGLSVVSCRAGVIPGIQGPASTPRELSPYSGLFGAARGANVIVRGTITSINMSQTTIDVKEVVRGGCPDRIVTSGILGDVIPPDVGAYVGREVYLFLSSAQGAVYYVQCHWELVPSTRARTLAVLREALRIAQIEDNVQFVRAVLAQAGSDDPWVRSEVRCFLQGVMQFYVDPQFVKDEIVTVFHSDDPGLRAGACYALQKVRADEMVPELLEMAASADASEAARAVGALAPYDTPDTIAALIGSAAHADSHVRSVAVETLGRSRRPEALKTVTAALQDANSTVRDRARRQVTAWFRDGVATEAVPVLLAQLAVVEDSEKREVLAALGASGDDRAVEPAVKVASSPDPVFYSHDSAFRALAELYPKVTPDAQARIRSVLPQVEKSALTEFSAPGFAAVLLLEAVGTPEATAMLQRLAARHPNAQVRKRAQTSRPLRAQ